MVSKLWHRYKAFLAWIQRGLQSRRHIAVRKAEPILQVMTAMLKAPGFFTFSTAVSVGFQCVLKSSAISWAVYAPLQMHQICGALAGAEGFGVDVGKT